VTAPNSVYSSSAVVHILAIQPCTDHTENTVSNISSIVACFDCHCPVMAISSHCTILAFSPHVTLFPLLGCSPQIIYRHIMIYSFARGYTYDACDHFHKWQLSIILAQCFCFHFYEGKILKVDGIPTELEC
jgi:hypothetical protein